MRLSPRQLIGWPVLVVAPSLMAVEPERAAHRHEGPVPQAVLERTAGRDLAVSPPPATAGETGQSAQSAYESAGPPRTFVGESWTQWLQPHPGSGHSSPRDLRSPLGILAGPWDGGAAGSLAPVWSWSTEGNQPSALLGPVASAGDVNGDGYDDLIVGAPGFDNGQVDEGRALLFLGSAGGLAPTPAWTAESDVTGAFFGYSVASAGDVNGDGYDDVIVGSPYYGSGWVDVFRGGPTGLEASPSWWAWSPYGVAGFGWSVHGAGDVNGDGYDDVIVGTRGGEAYVYHGGPANLTVGVRWRGTSPQPGIYYGETVAGAGDVNGDGYDDVIVGARLYANGQDAEGAAFVYHGSANGVTSPAAWMREGNQQWAWFGTSVDGAGDLNGDGFDDVIVGAQQYGYGGGAFAFHGSSTGLSPTPAWVVHSVTSTWNFGASVSGAGDVNGDGFADVIVGSFVRPRGSALLYLGSATGLSHVEAWRGADGQNDSDYGQWVAGAGDVTGDGRAEVAVGARAYDKGETNEGRVVVYQFPAGPPLPRVSVGDVAMTEGDSGETQAVFKVVLSAPSARAVTLRYATADGTAGAGSDYVAASGQLTIPAGAVEASVSTAVFGDTIVELSESFVLRVWDPAFATVARGEGTATIVNDDLPLLSVQATTVDEGSDGPWFALVSLSLSGPSDKPVTVDFATRDGTALAGRDYLPSAVRMGLLPGSFSTNVYVGIVGDHVSEAEETFDVVLGNPANAQLGQASASVTIRDDDAPGLSVDDVSVAEAAAGDVEGVFTVTLSPPSTDTVTVDYATADGTATAGSDYAAVSGTLSFPPLSTTASVPVSVHADGEREAPETFSLVLTNPTSAAIAHGQGTGTIVDAGYFPVTPCRVVDTRGANGPALIPGADRRFVVAGLCGIPAGARAVSINLTVTQPTVAGHLRVYPGGEPLPSASSLNYSAAQTRANNTIMKLGPVGELTVRCQQGTGSAHFVLDVNGYFE
jgi:hypothetical protein